MPEYRPEGRDTYTGSIATQELLSPRIRIKNSIKGSPDVRFPCPSPQASRRQQFPRPRRLSRPGRPRGTLAADFRSNHLGHLTDADVAVLRCSACRSAFDFRGTEERAEALCGLRGYRRHSLPVEPTVVAALRAIATTGTALSTEHALEVMRDSYRRYVQHNTPRFRALFAHLLEDRAPLVIHCTAGKDRTGFACALILHTLGVPDDVIAEDYLFTNRFYRRDPSASGDLPEHVKQVLGSVQKSVPHRGLRGHQRRLRRLEPISATGSVSVQTNAPHSRRAI